MLKVWISVLALMVALVAPTIAGQDELSPRELKEKETELTRMKRESPDKYRQTVVLVQMALGAFGFGTGPFDGVLDTKTRSAIRNYQRVRDLPQTGDLDARTFKKLFGDFDLWMRREVHLRNLSVGLESWDQGYVSAQGTWIIVGEKAGLPAQTTEIKCYKSWGRCFEVTALLYLDSNFLSVHSTIHEIERWDQHEITTKPDQSAVCVRYTMRIGRLQKSVTGLRLRTTDEGPCKDASGELQLKLADGREAMEHVNAERGETLKGLLQAPGFPVKP